MQIYTDKPRFHLGLEIMIFSLVSNGLESEVLRAHKRNLYGILFLFNPLKKLDI